MDKAYRLKELKSYKRNAMDMVVAQKEFEGKVKRLSRYANEEKLTTSSKKLMLDKMAKELNARAIAFEAVEKKEDTFWKWFQALKFKLKDVAETTENTATYMALNSLKRVKTEYPSLDFSFFS